MTNIEIVFSVIKSIFIIISPLMILPIIEMMLTKTNAMTLGHRKTYSRKDLIKKEISIFIKQITRVRVLESSRRSILIAVMSLVIVRTSFAAFPICEPIYISFEKYYWEIINSKTGIMYIVLSILVSNLMIIGNDGSDAEDKAQYFIVSKTTRLLISGLAIIFSLLSMFFYYGTVDLHILIQNQSDIIGYIFPKWGIVVQPISAIVFLFAIITLRASSKTNMVLSNNLESIEKRNYAVDGINRLTIKLSEFALIGLFIIIYLGGYNSIINFTFINERISYGLYFIQALSFIVKFIVFYLVYSWTIKSIPQFKYYRLIEDTIKRVLPLSIINLIITVIYFYYGNQ